MEHVENKIILKNSKRYKLTYPPKYCVIFVIYTQFTNAAADSIIKAEGLLIRDPRFREL
jgi:hypothetical protein